MVGASFDALVVLAGLARARGGDPWTVLGRRARPRRARAADRVALETFAAWFAPERDSAARRSVEDLIDRALERTGYDLKMLAMPGGRRRLANVRKLMRLGREYEEEHGADLAGFRAAAADRAAGRTADTHESEAPVEGDGLDAIRLMTIHRAKGLEWPTVCVADLGARPGPRTRSSVSAVMAALDCAFTAPVWPAGSQLSTTTRSAPRSARPTSTRSGACSTWP